MPRLETEKIERNILRVRMAAQQAGFEIDRKPTEQDKPGGNLLMISITPDKNIAITDGKGQIELRPAHAAWLTRHAKSQEDFWWNLTDLEYPPASLSGIW
jgi:hypothetical protein